MAQEDQQHGPTPQVAERHRLAVQRLQCEIRGAIAHSQDRHPLSLFPRGKRILPVHPSDADRRAILTWRRIRAAGSHGGSIAQAAARWLNEFLRRYARQTHEHGSAKTFVAVPDDDVTRVLGFYTLSPAAVDLSRTPEVIRRGLGRYDVPAFRLGRLAIERIVQGQGLVGEWA